MTDQEIRMFAVEQMALIYKSEGSPLKYSFLQDAQFIVEYIKTGEYPKQPNEEEQHE